VLFLGCILLGKPEILREFSLCFILKNQGIFIEFYWDSKNSFKIASSIICKFLNLILFLGCILLGKPEILREFSFCFILKIKEFL